MAYYHILHQRRLDLKLSINDVSEQTRLVPQYIQAIEENNLDVFSDDFSFVRYFVQSYCAAIGVNWQAISQEVDENVREYARMRDMALTQAQRKMVSQMSSVEHSRTKKKRKKNTINRHVSHTSRKLKSSQKKLIRSLIILFVGVVVILSLIRYGLNLVNAQNQSLIEEQQAEELAQKEKETAQLAKQKQKEEEAAKIKLKSVETNTYQITNIQDNVKTVELQITFPNEASTVSVYKDGELVNDSSKSYSDTLSMDLELSDNCTFEVQIDTYSENVITIDGKKAEFDESYWYEGYPAVIDFIVGEGDTTSTDDTSTDTTTDYSTDYSTDYYNNYYTGGSQYYESTQQTYYN